MPWKQVWAWQEEERDNCATLCCYFIGLIVVAAVVTAPLLVVVGTTTPGLLEYPATPTTNTMRHGLWLNCTEQLKDQRDFQCQHFYWPDHHFKSSEAHKVRALQTFGVLSTVSSLLCLACPLVACYNKALMLPLTTVAYTVSAILDAVFVGVFWGCWQAILLTSGGVPGWSAIITTVGFGCKAVVAVIAICLCCNSHDPAKVGPTEPA